MAQLYRVEDVFYGIQKEGERSGEASVFVHLAEDKGLEYTGYEVMERIYETMAKTNTHVSLENGTPPVTLFGRSVGGENDVYLVGLLVAHGYYVILETHGHAPVRARPDYLIVQRLLREENEEFKQREADEIQFEIDAEHWLPDLPVHSKRKYLFPALKDDGSLYPGAMERCVELVKKNPEWRVSLGRVCPGGSFSW